MTPHSSAKGPLFLVVVDLADGVVDIDERQPAPANSRGTAAANPAITQAALAAAFGHGTLNRCSSRSGKPARWASRITGTRPAEPIRFGPSKTADILCDACTCQIPLRS